MYVHHKVGSQSYGCTVGTTTPHDMSAVLSATAGGAQHRAAERAAASRAEHSLSPRDVVIEEDEDACMKCSSIIHPCIYLCSSSMALLIYVIYSLLLLPLCFPNEHEELWSNWLGLVKQYNVPTLEEDFKASSHSTVTVIGGCPLAGIDRIISYVMKKQLTTIHLGPVAWNLTTHNMQSSSFGSLPFSEIERSMIASYISNAIKLDNTPSSSLLPQSPLVIIDDTGFDNLLELSTLIPSLAGKTIEYFLVATEPEMFISSLKKHRKTIPDDASANLCDQKYRLSSAKLNAKYIEIDQRFVAAFGVNCPSDIHAVKMYHYRNALAKLISVFSKSKINLNVIDINTNADVYNGEGARELCKRLHSHERSSSIIESCILELEEQVDMIYTPKQASHKSYSQELEKLHDLQSGKKFFESVFIESVHMVAANSDNSESLASYLLKQYAVNDENSAAFIIGGGLSKTGTTSLTKTLRDWGIRSSHWTVGHHLFRLAEMEVGSDVNQSAVTTSTHAATSKHASYVHSLVNKFEALADLPIPFFQPELEMIRPNNVVLLTIRRSTSWIRSFRAWLTKSCKSQTFHGCPGKVDTFPPEIGGSSKNRYRLMVDACPANLLAFGNSCPSDIQSLKRMYVHNFMVQVMTPKPFLIIEDVTVANSTFQMCNSLKVALQKRKFYILGTKQIKDNDPKIARKLNRRDGSGKMLVENEKDYLWIHPKESKSPRSLQTLFDLLECSPMETFAVANVNKALKKQTKQQSLK